MYPIVNEHYKVINSMRELAAEVGEDTHSGSHAQVLGEMLPSSEQHNLYLDGDSALNFTELEKAPEPETDQTTSVTQESNKAERTQNTDKRQGGVSRRARGT